ncbi:2Fe-2S iron-sulfur cluster-binding protein [Actinomycetospora corticicola]|uniref:Ferredoxin-NADP reductase n=1 Tax=Actinomycetospora corticicola TaxID=663602 RepID=A0A7Y9DRB5_9PSEU|nr:ferredoxin-NADP reductase [Actinomycetospora corticicola]
MTASTAVTGPGSAADGTAGLDLLVERRELVADDVVALTLTRPGGAALPAWTPGAHVELHLDGFVRPYSLCGDPHDDHRWRIAVLRVPAGRGGSARVHDTLHPGATIRVLGPRNRFALLSAPSYRFVAGGIGITPLLPMIAEAETRGADWHLTYGGRSTSTMAFADRLRAEHPDRVELWPEDTCGLLDLRRAVGELEPDGLVYCCGPAPLLAAITAHTADRPPGVLHLERFTPVEDAAGDERREGFEIELAASGRRLVVPPGRTVLETLEDAGVDMLSSCRAGTCGTCETGVLAGEVDHRDALLSAEERSAHDTMFVCVSRAASARLVLDL